MIDLFYSPRTDTGHLRCGPLKSHLDGFAALLSRHSYFTLYGRRKIRVVSDLSRWLCRRHLQANDLKEEHISHFLMNRKKQGRLRGGDRQTLMQLMAHLRRAGIVRSVSQTGRNDPIAQIAADYVQFLRLQRGLSQATIHTYLPTVQRFLMTRFGRGTLRLNRLRVADVTGFILRDRATVSAKRKQSVASALRSFLGFLTQQGKIALNLAAAVPSVANWRMAELPRFLEPDQVEKLLNTCPRNTPRGRRDYAILLLLARLGLRAGEVAHLNLEDLDWNSGEVLIRGKSSRDDCLPLPPEVGRALANYLRNDRPPCACRRVFLRMEAPSEGFSSSSTIGHIVQQSLRRAQLPPGHTGAHLLRHSLATRMLRGGATLTQIGQILRHQHAQTTEIYAKVDLAALRAVALPWPGGAR